MPTAHAVRVYGSTCGTVLDEPDQPHAGRPKTCGEVGSKLHRRNLLVFLTPLEELCSSFRGENAGRAQGRCGTHRRLHRPAALLIAQACSGAANLHLLQCMYAAIHLRCLALEQYVQRSAALGAIVADARCAGYAGSRAGLLRFWSQVDGHGAPVVVQTAGTSSAAGWQARPAHAARCRMQQHAQRAPGGLPTPRCRATD